jgi:hypothetical protein
VKSSGSAGNDGAKNTPIQRRAHKDSPARSSFGNSVRERPEYGRKHHHAALAARVMNRDRVVGVVDEELPADAAAGLSAGHTWSSPRTATSTHWC